jgi:hypothetical protein
MSAVRPPRYNARARQSTVGASTKQGKRADTHDPVDPNAEVFVSKTKYEKELEKKERLRQEV